MKKDHYEKIFF